MFWQRLMFPGSHPPSIFSAEKLNFCVRYGYRCDLLAIATKYDYTFFKSVCNKTNQFYQTLNVNKSLSCDVFMTTVATLLFKSVCYTNNILCFQLKRESKKFLTHNIVHKTLALYFLCLLGQALDLLVSVSLMCYHTYTSDLSTT